MKTPQNIQPSFDDEISIADIIHFLKSHKKIILIFVIIGTLLGGLYGNFTEPVYKGSILISPAKIAESYEATPKFILGKISMNSKEVFLNCNPDHFKDKDIDFDISNIVKVSILKNSGMIELSMQDKNATVIKDCLNNLADHILTTQNMFTEPLLQLKKNRLRIAEEKLKDAEELKVKLNRKELKSDIETSPTDLLYTNIIFFNSRDIKELLSEINAIQIDLYMGKIKQAEKISPVRIEKSFPTPKLGALIGLFLGLCFGILIVLIKQMKI